MPNPVRRRRVGISASSMAATGMRVGLQAAYTFENGGNLGADSGPNANNLTNNNAATQGAGNAAPGTHGVVLTAASSQSLSIASNATLVLSGTSWELTAWVKFASYGGAFQTIVGKWGGSGGLEYLLSYNPNDTKIHASVSTDGVAQVELTTTRPVVGSWMFLDMWFDAAAMFLHANADNAAFTDGGAANVGSGLNGGTNAFGVGANGFGAPLDGAADSVNLWKRLLTPSERTALYNAGAGLESPFQ